MDMSTTGASVSLVSENIMIEGELSGDENILINGRVRGSIKLNGDIVIGNTGIVEADIDGNTIISDRPKSARLPPSMATRSSFRVRSKVM